LEDELVWVLRAGSVRLQRIDQCVDASEKTVVDDAVILERLDLDFAVSPFLVYLVLLCADEGALVDIGVYFDVGIIAEL